MNLTVDLVPRPPAFYDVNNGSVILHGKPMRSQHWLYDYAVWKRVHQKQKERKKMCEEETADNYENHLQ